MEYNEKDFYEAFGLTVEGEEEADLADPHTDEGEAEGEEEQEFAAPAQEDVEEEEAIDGSENDADDDEAGEDNAESDEKAEEGAPDGKNAQSREERARFAAQRRRAELEAKISKARSEAEERAAKEIEELLLINPMKDPKTGKPITTAEEYRAAKDSLAEKKQTDLLKKTGMSKEELEGYISDLPEVKAAREETERIKRENARAQIERDIAEIAKYDPSIRTIEDLAKSESYNAIYERVTQHNDSLFDAYRFVHGEAIAKKNLEAARNAERQKAAGKAHLSRTAGRGGSGVNVPKDVMEMYRELNPGISDAEIAKHYQKSQ